MKMFMFLQRSHTSLQSVHSSSVTRPMWHFNNTKDTHTEEILAHAQPYAGGPPLVNHQCLNVFSIRWERVMPWKSTPTKTAEVRHTWLDERVMHKWRNYVLKPEPPAANNANETTMAPTVRSGRLSGFSRREDVFTHKLLQSLYFQCNLRRQWRNKLYHCSRYRRLIPVNFDGSYHASAW
jgi:hypothetical protein